MTYFGNISLLNKPKQAFLCSRCTCCSVILPCLDWATEHRKGSSPVISTFHSILEQSVLDLLISGTCPIIIVLGRSLYKNLPTKLQPLIEQNRLLIISLSNSNRISRDSAAKCNNFICEQSSEITFGYISPKSHLNSLYNSSLLTKKKIHLLSEQVLATDSEKV